MVQYFPKTAHSILNRLKVIDSWFWCRYTLNPYNGCEHACTYCDARSDRYYLHEDFEERIYYKANAAQLLDQKLTNTRTWLPDVIAMGGTCDAYQPAEATYEISNALLKVVLKHRYRVILSAKSTLIRRDLLLLEEIGKSSWCTVAFTITTLDPKVVQFLEPRTASPEESNIIRREPNCDSPSSGERNGNSPNHLYVKALVRCISGVVGRIGRIREFAEKLQIFILV